VKVVGGWVKVVVVVVRRRSLWWIEVLLNDRSHCSLAQHLAPITVNTPTLLCRHCADQGTRMGPPTCTVDGRDTAWIVIWAAVVESFHGIADREPAAAHSASTAARRANAQAAAATAAGDAAAAAAAAATVVVAAVHDAPDPSGWHLVLLVAVVVV
jgi:hypothetical protein